MNCQEVTAKSLLRKHKRIDSWFVSRAGMNLYRGCSHNCAYCDGRAEKYRVTGEFGRDVSVKINAVTVAENELSPRRSRNTLNSGYIMIGGGVGDAYQPAELKYRLSREILKRIDRFHLPVHILTKSTLVERDIDLLCRINEKARTVVSFSFSSVDPSMCRLFEPGIPGPQERLDLIGRLKRQGIACAMFLLPVIPGISDSDEQLDRSLAAAVEAGVDFIIFGGMTLKQGRQSDYFVRTLKQVRPDLEQMFHDLYPGNAWGVARGEYYQDLNRRFYALAQTYRLPLRMPPSLYKDLLSENDRIIVMLDHIDYYLKMKSQPSPYGLAAHSISRLKQPLSEQTKDIKTLRGIGPVTEALIEEIRRTGSSSYLERLSHYGTAERAKP